MRVALTLTHNTNPKNKKHIVLHLVLYKYTYIQTRKALLTMCILYGYDKGIHGSCKTNYRILEDFMIKICNILFPRKNEKKNLNIMLNLIEWK